MERRSPERVQGTNTKEQQYHGKQAEAQGAWPVA